MSTLGIVLAAGEGTRMRSSLPKVLHQVANRPLVGHVAASAAASGIERLAVVAGPGMDAVVDAVRSFVPDAAGFTQTERRGTGHAALCARSAITADLDAVLVLIGDAPLVRPETIAAAQQALAQGADVVVVGFYARDPFGYGRLIVEDGQVKAIREENDASDAERSITFCNSGLIGFAARHLPGLLEQIGDDNPKGEFYLTDAIALADAAGLIVRAIEAGEDEMMGINDRAQLAACEAAFQTARRRQALLSGVTLIAPDTVYFSADTELGGDVVIEPHVVFGSGVRVESGARIKAFSHLEGAQVAAGAQIGPYARLRPGSRIGPQARIGNFVEVKNATFGTGAKANHLSYVGDAEVGDRANIGAGTITCNYDGYAKHRTVIGAGAFVGSNSALVAPVSVGAGAFVGSGSVVTADVPEDALALGRGRQVVRDGWASRFRAANKAGKEPG